MDPERLPGGPLDGREGEERFASAQPEKHLRRREFEQPGPNIPSPGGVHPGPGGGKVGAVLLSPCIKPGTVNKTPYNHYSMLRSIEDNFGLPHLGYAGRQGLKPFGRKTLNRRRLRPPPLLSPSRVPPL